MYYLGGTVARPRKKGPPVIGFNMRKPGALHHARFMSSSLYLMKISMLVPSLPPNMLTAEKEEEVKRMAQFIALFYAPYFLQARLPTLAPLLDIKLWEDMQSYQIFDAVVAGQVLQSILRQAWYLTQELVVLCLFDPQLDHSIKTEMSHSLLSFNRPQIFRPKKPVFPTHILEGGDTSLSSFIGERSWLIFHLLGATGRWLNQNPITWTDDPEFQRMYDVVSSLSVVNDTAERGVKDIEDYANATTDSDHRERIILVANSHRNRISGEFLKSEMEQFI